MLGVRRVGYSQSKRVKLRTWAAGLSFKQLCMAGTGLALPGKVFQTDNPVCGGTDCAKQPVQNFTGYACRSVVTEKTAALP